VPQSLYENSGNILGKSQAIESVFSHFI
jgi:hypothetical protein